MRRDPILVALLALVSTAPLAAQQRIASVEEALSVDGQLAGRGGPAGLNWIDDGGRYSYIARNAQSGRPEVRGVDPASGDDELLFDAGGLMVPGTTQPLQFRAFDWSADSRHVVFQADFRPIYRRSGVADFYVYDVADGSMVLAADDARTAELSPDGSFLGYEREGDLFVYDTDAEQ